MLQERVKVFFHQLLQQLQIALASLDLQAVNLFRRELGSADSRVPDGLAVVVHVVGVNVGGVFRRQLSSQGKLVLDEGLPGFLFFLGGFGSVITFVVAVA